MAFGDPDPPRVSQPDFQKAIVQISRALIDRAQQDMPKRWTSCPRLARELPLQFAKPAKIGSRKLANHARFGLRIDYSDSSPVPV